MLEFAVALIFYSSYLFWTVYASVSSASLSLLATGIDSVFDVGGNVLLYYINHKSSRMDVNKWPVGGARLETIGNVVYGTLFWLAKSMDFVDPSSPGFMCEVNLLGTLDRY
jgi:divalent metal cation (Fe/Co/Zn/Cd) transporter